MGEQQFAQKAEALQTATKAFCTEKEPLNYGSKLSNVLHTAAQVNPGDWQKVMEAMRPGGLSSIFGNGFQLQENVRPENGKYSGFYYDCGGGKHVEVNLPQADSAGVRSYVARAQTSQASLSIREGDKDVFVLPKF
jgi:hypothetical protein